MEEQRKSGAIQLVDLEVGYRKHSLIKEINFAVQEGEILTLIGPNGAGKSTILKSIAGQLSPLGGTVYIGKEDWRDFSKKRLAQTLSMVMTVQPSTEYMTCREVVAVGRYPYTGRLGILSEQDREVVEESLRLTNTLAVADRDFMELSDGLRQRVILAKALCQEPKVLILDEPTSYLDVHYKLEILQTIRSLVLQKQMAVIMSLHELELARKLSDIIVCIKEDQVWRVGTPKDIFCADTIEKLYGLEKGSFDPLTGMVQLPAPTGEPEVFVIGGGGSAVDTYYELQRKGIPFAVGILPENDVEFPFAHALAGRMYAVAAYEEPEETLLGEAKACMDHCRQVLCPLEKFGAHNAYNRELLLYARSCGKLLEEEKEG